MEEVYYTHKDKDRWLFPPKWHNVVSSLWEISGRLQLFTHPV